MAALLSFALAGCPRGAPDAPAAPPAQPGSRPSVLLLVMDTVRGDRCSWLGYHRPTTPALDEFARDAVSFTRAWGPASWTGPAHATMFTGLRPHQHGFLEGNREFLAPDARTLAEVLGEAGYRTGAFTNNDVVSPEYGLTQGFHKVEEYYAGPPRSRPPARATHDDALAWARRVHASGQPFFLFINDIEPHLPYDPPDEPSGDRVRAWLDPGVTPATLAYARSFTNPRSDGYNLGVVELEPGFIQLLSDLYDGEIATLDAEIGSLLAGLRKHGLLDSTLVIVTSDHGENFGEHGLLDHKWDLHRSILHLPLLLRLPGRFDGGRRVDAPVRLEDLFPTVLEVAGVPVPAALDGRSLARDLEGRVVRSSMGTRVHQMGTLKQHFPEADTRRLLETSESVFDGRWHYLRSGAGVEELYDVTADPQEIDNLAASEPAVLGRLRPLLEPHVPQPPLTPDGLPVAADPR